MFDFIRTHRRLMQFVLLLFIFPSFAFFGLEGYTRFRGGDDAVARVGDQPITRQEFEAAQRQQMDQLRQMFGGQLDPSLLDTPEARRNILENLIVQRVLALEARDKLLAVSDQTLQQTILGMPGLTGEDGKFDPERYKNVLAQRGMTPALFEARLRHDLVLEQLNNSVQGTTIAPRTVSNRLSDLNDQEREVQALMFRSEDYASQVNVTEEMLRKYYEDHGREFELPARVDAEYVVLSMDAIANSIEVSDADVKAYYEQNKARFSEPEQRRASHILIRTESDAEREAARKKAEEIAAQARANPESFAELARKHSQDPGSAEQGGDLDFFGRGMMVKPFEDAAFGLEKGQISDVVETDFGFHVIKVTDVRPGTVKPLDAVRDELVAEIRKQQASRRFSEAAQQFSDIVFNQSDSLKPAAEQLKLEIRQVEGLTRAPNPELEANAPYNQPAFLEQLFSQDVIKSKNNTKAVEVAPGTLIAGRAVQYRPEARRPFEEVEDEIRERVRKQEANRLAREAGEQQLKGLREGGEAKGFGDAQRVSRVKPGELPTPALRAIMRAETDKLPVFVGVEIPDQGYGIYRINSVSQAQNPDEQRRASEQQQIAQAIAGQETHAYIEALKQKYEVEILNLDRPAQAGEGEEAS